MNDFENINISDISEEELVLNKRYKLDKKIGEGSYGVVYRAFDTKNNNNLVAIKQVSKARINSNAYLIEALQKELSIMRLISDENSVKLIEDFETPEHYNLVMELCDSDLDAELKKRLLLNKKGFNELEVYTIMKQFNKVFSKMQKEHVIHRDLKLKNIMIKKDKNIDTIGFVIKLSDFGFSKVVNEDDVTGTNLGSPATKAPEIMIGRDYNAKVDLWSVGVIMFQLFFNRLPFQASNARQLQEVIFNSNGVKLPKDIDNPMSDICFNLIDKLLQKEPSKRIDFDKYFNNEFFSKKHEYDLLNNLCKIKEVDNKKGTNFAKDEGEKENNNNNNNNTNTNKKNENKNGNNINKSYNNDKIDFEQRFIKLIKIKEYNLGYNLYKAKDTLYDKIVYIKEISRAIIDNNERNKKIFDKEIKLLSTLKGEKFPEFIGLFKTNLYYNIIIEYFSGNNLQNFIDNHSCLSESLVILILKQLKPSLIELNEKNIVLDFICPKNFAFTFYINDTNFEIKFFDYGLSSIFYEEKYVKSFLLEEAELGEVKDPSINIFGMGLTVCKMLFGEEALIKKNDNYEIKIKGKIKGEFKEDMKTFLSRCIKHERRYKWDEFFMDDFINSNLVDQKTFTNLDKKKEPLVKDEQIEKIFEIIIKKLNYIINYFDKLLQDKEHLSDSEVYNELFSDSLSLIYFCILECKTIKNFLKINADTIKSKIDKTNQDIHLFKIYLNKSVKDENKYYYSSINFIDDGKGNNQYLYNKENPTFEIYFKIFDEIEKKIEIIINKMRGNKVINSNSNETRDKTNSSSEEFSSSPDNSGLVISNERTSSDNNDDRIDNERIIEDGNFDQLFMNFFENGVKSYYFEEKEKAIEELNMAKYIDEYFIFSRVILGNKDRTENFEKIWIEEAGNKNKNNNDYVIFATFLGGKIELLKERGIIGCDSSTDDLNTYIEPKIENIKIYNGMIDFYPRILQFIEEIKKN